MRRSSLAVRLGSLGLSTLLVLTGCGGELSGADPRSDETGRTPSAASSTWTSVDPGGGGGVPALAAWGDHVWSGGDNGGVRRSQDAGESWTTHNAGLALEEEGTRNIESLAVVPETDDAPAPRFLLSTTKSGKVYRRGLWAPKWSLATLTADPALKATGPIALPGYLNAIETDYAYVGEGDVNFLRTMEEGDSLPHSMARLLCSKDRGNTFTVLDSPWTSRPNGRGVHLTSLAMLAGDPNRVLVASTEGVKMFVGQSCDATKTKIKWRDVVVTGAPATADVRAVFTDRNSGGTDHVAWLLPPLGYRGSYDSYGLYRVNGRLSGYDPLNPDGWTWARAGNQGLPWGSDGRVFTRMARSTKHQSVMFLLGNKRTDEGLYVTTNRGDSWTPIFGSSQIAGAQTGWEQGAFHGTLELTLTEECVGDTCGVKHVYLSGCNGHIFKGTYKDASGKLMVFTPSAGGTWSFKQVTSQNIGLDIDGHSKLFQGRGIPLMVPRSAGLDPISGDLFLLYGDNGVFDARPPTTPGAPHSFRHPFDRHAVATGIAFSPNGTAFVSFMSNNKPEKANEGGVWKRDPSRNWSTVSEGGPAVFALEHDGTRLWGAYPGGLFYSPTPFSAPSTKAAGSTQEVRRLALGKANGTRAIFALPHTGAKVQYWALPPSTPPGTITINTPPATCSDRPDELRSFGTSALFLTWCGALYRANTSTATTIAAGFTKVAGGPAFGIRDVLHRPSQDQIWLATEEKGILPITCTVPETCVLSDDLVLAATKVDGGLDGNVPFRLLADLGGQVYAGAAGGSGFFRLDVSP